MRGEIDRILAAFERAGVRYVVVGGVAVVLHGHMRLTADLDLVVKLERRNVEAALRVLSELGYRPRAPVPALGFADPDTRESWVRDKGMIVFSFARPEQPGLEVDLFAHEPFPFDEVYARTVRVPLATTKAVVIGLDDLLALKTRTGRANDRADVEALRALRDRGADRHA
jgi:predicted nucleotidyltransferase